MTCNCSQCRGEGPRDDDDIDVPDDFVEEWIEDHREKIIEHFLPQIEEAYAEKRASDLEEQEIARAEDMAEARRDWDNDL
jgi:hypothetical protein